MPELTADRALDAVYVVENLADLVRDKAFRCRLTYLELSGVVDVDHSVIGRFLAGKRGVTTATALKFMRWLSEEERP